MPTLIACLSTGKGTWAEVTKLIQSQPWSKVFLITNDFGRQNFTPKNGNCHLIEINPFQETAELVDTIKKQLQGKITDFEVALNLASGSGREHMAILEAVMELGLNFRLVTAEKNQVEVLGLR